MQFLAKIKKIIKVYFFSVSFYTMQEVITQDVNVEARSYFNNIIDSEWHNQLIINYSFPKHHTAISLLAPDMEGMFIFIEVPTSLPAIGSIEC